MPFMVLVIGAILIVVAFNNTFGQLATELETDIPGFFVWAAAIAAILALGYIPGFRTPSRWLLALVLIVIVMTNYQQILSGFTAFSQSGGTAAGSAAANPSAAYSASPQTGSTTGSAALIPTSQEVAGTAATSSTQVASTAASATQTLTAAQALAANPLNPNAYVALSAGFGGLA